MRTNPIGIAVGVEVVVTLYAACVISVWSLAELAHLASNTVRAYLAGRTVHA
jgi:hypothetical protein